MLSFPQRIATRERPTDFSPRHLRRFRRVRYGEKFVLGAEAFADRIEDRVSVSQVFVTSRQSGKPRLRRLPRWRLAWPLTKWLVVGFETPQMWELFLRPSMADVNLKVGILQSRLGVAVGLLKRAKAYRLVLGADSSENVTFVANFLQESKCD